MRWTEITLSGIQPLYFDGGQVGTLERREASDGMDSALIHFNTGTHVELPAAVDVSQRLDCPRVFVVEGTPRDLFLLLGGEKAYRVSRAGLLMSEFKLFRDWFGTEYWTTRVISQPNGSLFIYEGGVVAIDATLQVRWHTSKHFNDYVVAIDKDTVLFSRDRDIEWSMSLQDGSTSL
jgi:hypothetical protein